MIRGNIRGARPDGTPLGVGEWPLDRSLRGERVGPEEIRLPGEPRRVILASSAPVRDARGRVEIAVATFHDKALGRRDRDIPSSRTHDRIRSIFRNTQWTLGSLGSIETLSFL